MLSLDRLEDGSPQLVDVLGPLRLFQRPRFQEAQLCAIEGHSKFTAVHVLHESLAR